MRYQSLVSTAYLSLKEQTAISVVHVNWTSDSLRSGIGQGEQPIPLVSIRQDGLSVKLTENDFSYHPNP